MSLPPGSARALGLALGMAGDAVFGDPTRGHPVAGFGSWASWLEAQVYSDSRNAGLRFTATAVGVPLVAAVLVEGATAGRPYARVVTTALATWAVLGGASLAREGRRMTVRLEAASQGGGSASAQRALAAARHGLRSLCAREPDTLGVAELARATVESLAENSSDAVIAPLFWGAVAGVPGLVAYRAINTLDAMVGYRSPRYTHFGWASARLDDLANLAPARLAGWLTCALAPLVGGSAGVAVATMRRDARSHPSPNGGWPEAAAAGALGVHLGGRSTYAGETEVRAKLGQGRAVVASDVARAVRLTRAVGWVGAGIAVALATGLRPRRGRQARRAKSDR